MSCQPILGNSDTSEDTYQNKNTRGDNDHTVLTADVNSKIFDQHNTIIPDFSEVVTDTESNRQYYCISTKTEQKVDNMGRVENETIDTIVRKLNDDKKTKHVKNNDSHDTSTYVTNSKFSSVFGDMSLDLLSMVNLVRGLNSKVAEHGQNSQNITLDVCGLVEENKRLRELLAKTKVDNNRRYDSLCKNYDAKFIV